MLCVYVCRDVHESQCGVFVCEAREVRCVLNTPWPWAVQAVDTVLCC